MGRVKVADIVQVVGLAALSVGGFLVGAWLGWMIAGAGLTVLGVALERK